MSMENQPTVMVMRVALNYLFSFTNLYRICLRKVIQSLTIIFLFIFNLQISIILQRLQLIKVLINYNKQDQPYLRPFNLDINYQSKTNDRSTKLSRPTSLNLYNPYSISVSSFSQLHSYFACTPFRTDYLYLLQVRTSEFIDCVILLLSLMQDSLKKRQQIRKKQRLRDHERVRNFERERIVRALEFEQRCKQLDSNVEVELKQFIDRQKEREVQIQRQRERKEVQYFQMYEEYLQQQQREESAKESVIQWTADRLKFHFRLSKEMDIQ